MMRLSAALTRRATAASSGLIVAEGADADAIGIGIGRFGNKLLSALMFGITAGAGLLTAVATGASSSQVSILCSPYSLSYCF
jgi:hypothetical protein